MSRIICLTFFSVFLSAGAVGAQALTVRISVKVVLDAKGNRPSSGLSHTNSQIEDSIRSSNDILRWNGADWLLHLVEVVDAPGISEWYDPALPCVTVVHRIAEAARSDPELYQWRSDAINIYVVGELPDCGGYCSFPGSQTDTIVINNTRDFVAVRKNLWLHEIGHYFNLCHTQGCPCSSCDRGCRMLPRHDDVTDTILDLQCWDQDDIASENFGSSYAELVLEQQRQVDDVFFNLMSYHRNERLDRGEAILTAGQLARMESEMHPESGRRRGVVYASEVGRQIPGDCNPDGNVDLSDAVCVFEGLFRRPGVFPCGDSASAAGNVALIDWQPDGRVDLLDGIGLLQFLFVEGSPHPLTLHWAKTACISIPGCPHSADCQPKK